MIEFTAWGSELLALTKMLNEICGKGCRDSLQGIRFDAVEVELQDKGKVKAIEVMVTDSYRMIATVLSESDKARPEGWTIGRWGAERIVAVPKDAWNIAVAYTATKVDKVTVQLQPDNVMMINERVENSIQLGCGVSNLNGVNWRVLLPSLDREHKPDPKFVLDYQLLASTLKAAWARAGMKPTQQAVTMNQHDNLPVDIKCWRTNEPMRVVQMPTKSGIE
jgi:hypothetical protein